MYCFHQSYGILHIFAYFVNICLITGYLIRQGLHKFQQTLSTAVYGVAQSMTRLKRLSSSSSSSIPKEDSQNIKFRVYLIYRKVNPTSSFYSLEHVKTWWKTHCGEFSYVPVLPTSYSSHLLSSSSSPCHPHLVNI